MQKGGTLAEMLFLVPNTPEGRINRQQTLETAPSGVFFPVSSRSGGSTRTPGSREPRRAQESSTGSSQVFRHPSSSSGPPQVFAPPSSPGSPSPQHSINKVSGNGFKWDGGGGGGGGLEVERKDASRRGEAPGKGRTGGVRPEKVSGETAIPFECTCVRVQGCSPRAYLPTGPSCCLSALP